jgi:hypothetical protein
MAISQKQVKQSQRWSDTDAIPSPPPFRFQASDLDRRPEIYRHVLANARNRNGAPRIIVASERQRVGKGPAGDGQFNAGPKGIHACTIARRCGGCQ